MTVTELEHALAGLPPFATVHLDNADGAPELIDVSMSIRVDRSTFKNSRDWDDRTTVWLEFEDPPTPENETDEGRRHGQSTEHGKRNRPRSSESRSTR